MPSEIVPIWDAGGKYVLDLVPHQDHRIWIAQGAINTSRDPAENQCVVLPQEYSFFPGDDCHGGQFADDRRGTPDVMAELSTAYAHRGKMT